MWAVGNHMDKFLISRYFKDGGSPKAMVMVQVLLDVLVLPVIYFFNPDIFSLPFAHIFILIALGCFCYLPILLYLFAIQQDEASVVIPLFQTIPVFLYILGYLILGEQLTGRQTLASALIILGAFLVSIDIFERKFRTKTKVLLFMLIASLCWAIRGVIFKNVLIQNQFWPVIFWEILGFCLGGLILLATVPSFRQQLGQLFRDHSWRIITINIINELMNTGAGFIVAFAYLLAPITLVAVMGSFQPMFVFLIGIIITLFIPKFGKETLLTHHLVQKFIAIGIMIFGSYLLNS